MARGLDSDYIGSLSIMDGFDMGVTFEGLGENMMKFMELPFKYLDSAHDKAVELVEDIHALIYASSPDDELPNKDHLSLTDPSSESTLTGSPLTSVDQQVNHIEEFASCPSSVIAAEDCSLSPSHTDVHETDLVSFKSQARCASEHTISLEGTVDTKEEGVFGNSEDLSTVSSEEEIILWNPSNSVISPQPTEQATVIQDFVSQEANGNRIIEEVELHGSGHSEHSACDGAVLLGQANDGEQSDLCCANSHEESTYAGSMEDFSGGTSSHYLSADGFSVADDPNIFADETTDFVNIVLQDDKEQMKYNKAEASSVPQPKNTSLKRQLIKSLSNKLRWSKKDKNVHQDVPTRVQKSVDVHYEVVCSSDGLEDDWELL